MQGRPEVARVLHPALSGSPGHEHWLATGGRGAACLFSAVFQPQYGMAAVDAFVDALQLFGIGYSWAGPMSLAVPYDLSRSRQLPLPYREGVIVRFAIGLEAEADLRADLAQALAQLPT
jgi:cystathionine beta-lyase